MKLDELRKQLRTVPDPKDVTSAEFSAPKYARRERCLRCSDEFWMQADGWLICSECRRDDSFARLWLVIDDPLCIDCIAARAATRGVTPFCDACTSALKARPVEADE